MTHRKNEPGYYDTIISICNRAGFSPNVIQEAEGIFTILTLISTGMGVSLVTIWPLIMVIQGLCSGRFWMILQR